MFRFICFRKFRQVAKKERFVFDGRSLKVPRIKINTKIFRFLMYNEDLGDAFCEF